MTNNWKEVRLREISHLITKGTTPTTLGYSFVSRGINFIKAESVSSDGRFDTEKFAFIDERTHQALKRSILTEGDILFSMAGMVIGKTAVVTKDVLPANTNQALGIIRPDRTVADSRYIHYYLGNKSFNQYINSLVGQSAQPNLNLTEIGNLPILLPPLPIQRRIAEILGRLDDKIEVNRRINRTLEQMAQALYKHWFMDFGPFQDGEFVESELGPIPQGWAITTLKEITTKIGSGATPRGGSSVYVAEGTHLIRSQNVYDSAFVWEGLARISADEADKLRNVTVEEGDVLINITGDSILRTCVADRAVLPARVNQHVAIIRPEPNIPSHFIHQHLLRTETKELLLNMSSGATRKAVTKGNLENTQILLPAVSVLKKFRAKTDPFFVQISINNRESQKLAEIRDYLLPKLLSGEIAVEAAEEWAA